MNIEILLITQDDRVGANILQTLSAAGYTVNTIDAAFLGLMEGYKQKYALVIVDNSLLRFSGMSICERLREHEVTTPIILLVENRDMAELLKGFEVGADECMSKPLSYPLLLSKVRAMVRRNSNVKLDQLVFSDIAIHKSKRLVFRSGQAVPLKTREYDILLLLAERDGRPVHREMINRATAMGRQLSDTGSVDVHVSKLRKKLGCPNPIETVYGIGYRFRPAISG